MSILGINWPKSTQRIFIHSSQAGMPSRTDLCYPGVKMFLSQQRRKVLLLFLSCKGAYVEVCGTDAQCLFFGTFLEKFFPWILGGKFTSATLKYDDLSTGQLYIYQVKQFNSMCSQNSQKNLL